MRGTVAYAVITKFEARIREQWPPQQLKTFEPHEAPDTSIPSLAWAVDVAQIPALFGTPLVGVFILKHTNFLLLYTALAAGLIIFFFALEKIVPRKYEDLGLKPFGYRVSLLVIGGIGLNLGCAAIAAWALP